jgi:hypothetical protein
MPRSKKILCDFSVANQQKIENLIIMPPARALSQLKAASTKSERHCWKRLKPATQTDYVNHAEIYILKARI